jgi:arylsulfatase A-like enzyme
MNPAISSLALNHTHLKTLLSSVLACAVTLSPAAEPDAYLTPFGIGGSHASNWGAPANAGWIPQMAAIGIMSQRTCNTGWSEVEPAEGKWKWDFLDAQMSYLESQHIAFGGILAGSPRWNTKDKPGTLPVNNLAGWSRYVSEVVKHAKGRIKYWEVWNEPPNGTGRDQTAAAYAKIVVAAYDAAKAVDPGCKIGIAAKSVHVNYLEQAIKAGAKDHFDYITLHPYEVLNGIADNVGTEAVFMHIVPTVRKMLAAQNSARANVPIIFTELGSDTSKGADNQGHALVKAYTMGIAQGVACIQWFEGRDGDSGPMGLLDAKGKPRPAYTAMAQMILHLSQHPTYLGWVLLNDRDYGFVFRGAKGNVLVTWGHKGAPDHVAFEQAVQIVDPLTGKTTSADTYELTVAPILVLGPPADLVAKAQSNKMKPMPWGGDYAGAKSVSVTMGERNVERGLHTMSGEAVAEAVVAYGGSARAGSVPGGNVFIVDPDFLSYSTIPIEITMINTVPFLWLCRALLFCCVLALPLPAKAATLPNILFILTDDQGWATLSCYGNKLVPTPHLDALARDGMRFTDAYVMPQCTPTRAALFSGQHTARNGMWHVIPWYGYPWARMAEPAFREQFPRDSFSLPKGLRSARYVTGMAGKWHLTTGVDGDYVALKTEAGAAYGFDFVAPRGPGSQNEGDKQVDYLTGQAMQFIEQHRAQPWFFYLAHHTLHNKVSAPDGLVAKHLKQGAPAAGLGNATYRAAIEQMDASVGRLLAKLDELKLRDSTLVVFLTDNGGVKQIYEEQAFTSEGPDRVTKLRVREEQFDNAPLRSGKGTAYEGGIRVPCIVRWPGQIRGGSVEQTPVHVVDWLPTLLTAAGAATPPDYASDGVNLLPLLRGGDIAPRPLYWHMPLYDLLWGATPCAVIRDGDWKLIESFGDSFDKDGVYRTGACLQLFNLHDDLGEQHDLASSEPVRATRMRGQLRAWLKSIPAEVPSSNPRHDPVRELEKARTKLNP